MLYLRAILGLLALYSIAYLFSGNKKAINWRLVIMGVGLQILLAVLVIKVPGVAQIFDAVGRGFVQLLQFAGDGARFVFGGLAKNSFTDPTANHNLGFLFAFNVFPTIIFFSSLTAGLYYLGVLQKVVYCFSWILSRTMRLSGPESVAAAANVFLGQTEAPLLVKPFIKHMTRSELLCLMAGGMATLSGGILAVYVSLLGGNDPDMQVKFATFLLSASIMNAPAAIVISKILLPQTDMTELEVNCHVDQSEAGVNVIDAVSNGAADGLKLALNVGAMLIAFIAMISLLNYLLEDVVGYYSGLNAIIADSTNGIFSGLNLEYLLGRLFQGFAYLIGIDWSETLQVGSLLGTKTVINEFLAYEKLSQLITDKQLSEHAVVISTYALCGFSNFSSIAIQIGGIGGMAPNQRANLSKLGLRALLAASLACLASATIAGALIG